MIFAGIDFLQCNRDSPCLMISLPYARGAKTCHADEIAPLESRGTLLVMLLIVEIEKEQAASPRFQK